MLQTHEADLLVNGGIVITLDTERRILNPGHVAVKDGKIASVGVGAAPLRARETIDATGMVVLPGLVNAHAHLDQSLYRSCLDETQGSRHVLLKLASALTRDRARAAARLTLLELVKYGVTTTHESHWTHFHTDSTDGICDAVLDSGMRAVVARSIMDGNPLVMDPNERMPDASLETVDAVLTDLDRLERAYDSQHIRITPEPIAVLRTTPECILAMRDWAVRRGKIWHVHLAQDRAELAEALRAFGCGAVQYVQRLGALGSEMVAAHCGGGLLPEEVPLLGEAGARVAHCPETMLRWGEPFPPIWELEKAGAIVGVGVDGSGTNNGQNLWEAMKHAVYMQRMRYGDRYLGTAEQALELGTIKAARVLDMDRDIGSLQVGKHADLALFRLHQPHLMPAARLVNNLVYSGSNNMADTVIVGGQIILRDGRSTVFDEVVVMEEAQEAQRRIFEETGLSDQMTISRWPVLTPGHGA